MNKGRKKPDLLSVQQAADVLGVSRRTIYRYIYEQDPPLDHLRAGHVIVIERKALDRFIKDSEHKRFIKAVTNSKKG